MNVNHVDLTYQYSDEVTVSIISIYKGLVHVRRHWKLSVRIYTFHRGSWVIQRTIDEFIRFSKHLRKIFQENIMEFPEIEWVKNKRLNCFNRQNNNNNNNSITNNIITEESKKNLEIWFEVILSHNPILYFPDVQQFFEFDTHPPSFNLEYPIFQLEKIYPSQLISYDALKEWRETANECVFDDDQLSVLLQFLQDENLFGNDQYLTLNDTYEILSDYHFIDARVSVFKHLCSNIVILYFPFNWNLTKYYFRRRCSQYYFCTDNNNKDADDELRELLSRFNLCYINSYNNNNNNNNQNEKEEYQRIEKRLKEYQINLDINQNDQDEIEDEEIEEDEKNDQKMMRMGRLIDFCRLGYHDFVDQQMQFLYRELFPFSVQREQIQQILRKFHFH